MDVRGLGLTGTKENIAETPRYPCGPEAFPRLTIHQKLRRKTIWPFRCPVVPCQEIAPNPVATAASLAAGTCGVRAFVEEGALGLMRLKTLVNSTRACALTRSLIRKLRPKFMASVGWRWKR
jgi:hypothetical protein